MSSGFDRQRLNPEERANLVAYVDGELTEAEARSLSTKLTHSPTARREADLLRKTWDALDKLERPHVTDQFQDRTLTYIRSLEVDRAARFTPLIAPAATALKLAACAVAALAAGVGGYTAALNFWPDPDARVVRDLTLAEHLDEYLEVGDFQMLDALKNSPEFGTNRPSVP